MDQAIVTSAPLGAPEPAVPGAVQVSAQVLASGPAAARGGLVPVTLTLWQREMVRFFRQRSRVTGALATPIVFWLMLGSGLDRVFVATGSTGAEAAEPLGYLAYLFPGTITMILLFTAIFSTISVIEDRNEGFLQFVLVAPVSRLAIVLGKVLGGASVATLQGIVFLLLWPLVGAFPSLESALLAVVAMFVLSIGLTALGLCLAWVMDSTAGFHAIMNLVLFPMWFLCGAMFPVATAPAWLKVVMYANPLTYGQATLASLLVGRDTAALGLPLAVSAGLMVAACAAAVGAAVWVASRAR